MTKYYYVTNRDGTTYKGFKPFENDPDYAEAPDWINDDKIDRGNALHVVSHNPCNAFTFITRNHPVAHEVDPIDLKPQRAGKFRCRALKRLRTLSDEEFIGLFILNPYYYYNKANLACKNGWLTALNKCVKVGIIPTRDGANEGCINGHLDILNKCAELSVLPTVNGVNWVCARGHLHILNRCIELGVLPTEDGVNGAAANGHLNCLNRCIEVGILPTYSGGMFAAEKRHWACLNRCKEIGVYACTKGSNYGEEAP